MSIPTPDTSNRAAHKARILEFREVAPSHYQMRLHAPLLAQSARPGQFVHVLTTPNSDADNFTFDPLLRRAFSIMSVSSGESSSEMETIDILFRAEGRGTTRLSQARVGDEIDLLGPLGRAFDLSPFQLSSDVTPGLFHVKQLHARHKAIVVGGGVGVPPLVFLSDVLSKGGVLVEGIIGARAASEIVGLDELNSSCEHVSLTTDDGSRGHHGRVTDVLGGILNRTTGEEGIIPPVVYACGPLPMLRAVAQMCAQLRVKCQVSMEENMPCGIGVCNSCVVRVHQKNDDLAGQDSSPTDHETYWSAYHTYRRVCVEGPACWANEIDWEHNNG